MIVSILDDFKYFSKSKQINKILQRTKLKKYMETLYLSDGGSGFLDSDLLKIYKKKKIKVHNSHSRKINSFYRYDDKKKIAFIELSKICGVELVKKNINYLRKTSYGLGEAVNYVIKNGYKKIYIGLGASDATDVGIGFLNALGVIFYDKNGKKINLLKESWIKVNTVENESVKKLNYKYRNIKIYLLVDVILPLFGKKGSTFFFGQQKGAKKKRLFFIDKFVKNYFNIIKKLTLKKLNNKNSGSSGGIPLSIQLIFNTQISSGMNFFIKKIKLKEFLNKKKIKYILTGEGRLDSTTLLGKFTFQLSKFAKKNKLKIFGLFGQISDAKLKKNFNRSFIIGKKSKNINKKYKVSSGIIKKLHNISNRILHEIKKNGV